MSVRTTNFGPRVSFTTNLADPGPVHVFGDSNSTFEWDGPTNIDGALTATGAVALSGAVTTTSTLVGSGGVQIGSGATAMNMTSLNISDMSVSMGIVAGNESATTDGTIVGLTTDSIVLAMQPQSAWSAAYFDINYSSVVSVADTVHVIMTNSAETAVTPDNLNFQFIWVDPA